MKVRPFFSPNSLIVLYRDLIPPNRSQECAGCPNELTSGTAYYLSVNGRPAPFGEVCAQKYGATPLEGIPDRVNQRREVFRLTGKEVLGETLDPHSEAVARAALYVSARCDLLPAMGFEGRLRSSAAEAFFASYARGEPNRVALVRVRDMLEEHATNPARRYLLPGNLDACLVYGWALGRILEEAQKPQKWLDGVSYNRRLELDTKLKKNFYLTDTECADVLEMGTRYLPHPPTAITGHHFVAARPLPAKRAKEPKSQGELDLV
jgi:hypothetical protein